MSPLPVPAHRTARLALAAVAFAAVAASGPARAGSSASAQASATVIDPIAITADAPLSFGTVARGTSPGTVTVATSGTVTSDGGVGSTGGSASAARFTITGETGSTFRLDANTVSLDDGHGNSMPLDLIGDFDGAGSTAPGLPSNGTLAGGTQTLHLGGRLHVGTQQAVGDYHGDVRIDVSYQ